MSAPNDNPADPFKKALAEATKAWPNDPELNVAFRSTLRACPTDTVRLPQVSRRMTRDEVLLARGTADAFALRRRFTTTATQAAIPRKARWPAIFMRRWKPRAARRWARATCPAPPATSTPRSP